MARTMYVEIEMGNAAFDDGYGGAMETVRILRELASRLEVERGIPPRAVRLYDVNGNKVGLAEVATRKD
jgi:hypothetical protein